MNIPRTKNYNKSFIIVFAVHVFALFYSFHAREQKVTKSHVIALRMMTSNHATKRIVELPVIRPDKKLLDKTKASQKEQQPSLEQAAAVSESVVFNVKEQYQLGLRTTIDERKIVPTQAKKLRQSGGVQVTFTVLPDGLITNVKIVESSSFSRLDQAALDLITSIGKYRPFPQELSQLSQMDLAVEINYDLN